MAAPSWAWAGTASGSVSASSPVYPGSGVVAGDGILAVTWNKADAGSGDPPTLAAPTGWTEIATGVGGTGAAALNTGRVRATVHRRNTDANGTENGVTLSSFIANPVGSSLVYTLLFGVRPALSSDALLPAASSGSDAASGTAFSVVVAADPGLAVDDLAIALAGFDVGSGSGASAESISAPSTTLGAATERFDLSTSSGFAVRGVIWTATVTAGPSSGAPTIAATAAAAVTGVGMVLRIREAVQYFRPPTFKLYHAAPQQDRLMSRVPFERGYAVLDLGGGNLTPTYAQVLAGQGKQVILQSDWETSVRVYAGGYVHGPLSSQQVTDLTNAGYGAFLSTTPP